MVVRSPNGARFSENEHGTAVLLARARRTARGFYDPLVKTTFQHPACRSTPTTSALRSARTQATTGIATLKLQGEAIYDGRAKEYVHFRECQSTSGVRQFMSPLEGSSPDESEEMRNYVSWRVLPYFL